MYQIKILKSLIETTPDLLSLNKINEKLNYIFPDKENKELFSIIYKHRIKYDAMPSKDYLETYFSNEKDNEADKVYKEVVASSEKPGQIDAMVDQQFLYTSKYRMIKDIKEFEEILKTSNMSNLSDNIAEVSHKINRYISDINSDDKISITMYGDDVSLKLKREAEMIKQTGYYVAEYPFKEMTDVWGGIKRDDFINILSSTGQGKTTLMKWIAYHNAVNCGKNIVYLSLEMSAKSIETA